MGGICQVILHIRSIERINLLVVPNKGTTLRRAFWGSLEWLALRSKSDLVLHDPTMSSGSLICRLHNWPYFFNEQFRIYLWRTGVGFHEQAYLKSGLEQLLSPLTNPISFARTDVLFPSVAYQS